jgi:hypothetical protein
MYIITKNNGRGLQKRPLICEPEHRHETSMEEKATMLHPDSNIALLLSSASAERMAE